MNFPTTRYFSYGRIRVGYMDCFQNSNLPRACQAALAEFLRHVKYLYKWDSGDLGRSQEDLRFMDVVENCEIKMISVGCDSEYDKLWQFIQHTIKPTTTAKWYTFTKYFKYDEVKDELVRILDWPDALK